MRFVTNDEIANPEFVRDLRNHAARLGATLGLKPTDWRSWMYRTYADGYFAGDMRAVDACGREVFVDFDCFECSDAFEEERDSVATWFRDFCTPVPDHVVPRVRCCAVKRVVALGTLLRALNPGAAELWGVR